MINTVSSSDIVISINSVDWSKLTRPQFIDELEKYFKFIEPKNKSMQIQDALIVKIAEKINTVSFAEKVELIAYSDIGKLIYLLYPKCSADAIEFIKQTMFEIMSKTSVFKKIIIHDLKYKYFFQILSKMNNHADIDFIVNRINYCGRKAGLVSFLISCVRQSALTQYKSDAILSQIKSPMQFKTIRSIPCVNIQQFKFLNNSIIKFDYPPSVFVSIPFYKIESISDIQIAYKYYKTLILRYAKKTDIPFSIINEICKSACCTKNKRMRKTFFKLLIENVDPILISRPIVYEIQHLSKLERQKYNSILQLAVQDYINKLLLRAEINLNYNTLKEFL